jgi:hypothetical protein
MKTQLIVSAFLALSLAACSSPISVDSGELNPTDLETPDLLESEVVLSAVPAPWMGIKDLVTDFNTPTFGLDIATDANANVFVPIKRDTNLIGQNPEYSLVKLDSSGNIVWTVKRDIGAPNFVGRFTVATDPAGNVYLAGNTSINLGGQLLNGQQDAFVTKYNTNGKVVWTRLVSAGADDGATGVGVDSSGEVYVSGWTCGTGLRLGGKVIRGACDMFVTKFSNGGARRWVQLVGTDGNETAGSMDVSANGTIAVTGNTSAAFPGYGAPATGANAAFAAKLSSSGAIAWVKQFNDTIASDVTIDSAGDLITYGTSGNATLRKLRATDGQTLWSASRPIGIVYQVPIHVEAGPGNTIYVSYTSRIFDASIGSIGLFSPAGVELSGGGGGGAIIFDSSFAFRGNNIYVAGHTQSNNCNPTLYPNNCTSIIARAVKYDLNLVQQ